LADAGSVNLVILLGRIGNVGDLLKGKGSASGKRLLKLSLATHEVWRGGKEKKEWHTVVCWNRQADFASQYLEVGQMILVKGKLRSYLFAKTNEGGKGKLIEIEAEAITIVSRKSDKANTEEPESEEPF